MQNRHGNLTPAGNQAELGIPSLNVQPTPAPAGPGVDLVLLLDASNSMDGLIDQAKQQLWSVVNDFASARKDGQMPKLRVALLMYGNDGLPASENFIRQLVPLTDDLDSVSQALFAIRTNGGSEYCGAVIDSAARTLDWAPHAESYRTIFIAGNEPFTQGPTPFAEAISQAKQRGVVVNTIHCGDAQTGINGKWQEGATLGGGTYFTINSDRAVPQIPCPQDQPLLRLNQKLNDTYLWYGDAETRSRYAENQMAQDDNAMAEGASSNAQRVAAKSGGAYLNRGRDLVDSYNADNDVLSTIDEQELPEAMQKMTPEERVEHVKQLAEQRKQVQDEIQKLAAERATFLAEKMKELAEEGGDETLGDAMRKAVQSQLNDAGYEFEE